MTQKIHILICAIVLLASSAPLTAMELAPIGNRVASNVWPAPVGHRQPRRSEVRQLDAMGMQLANIEKDEAAVNDAIHSICRGCE